MLDKHITRLVKSDNGGPDLRGDHAAGRRHQAGRPRRRVRSGERVRRLRRPRRRARPRHPPGDRRGHRRAARRRHPAGHALQDHHQGHAAARPLGAAGRAARRHRRDLRLACSRATTPSPTRWRATTPTARAANSWPLLREPARPRGGSNGDSRSRPGDRPAHRRAASTPSRGAVHVRPPLPVPRALDGALAVRRVHRRARPEHADQRGLREHHAGGRRWPRTGSAPAAAAA